MPRSYGYGYQPPLGQYAQMMALEEDAAKRQERRQEAIRQQMAMDQYAQAGQDAGLRRQQMLQQMYAQQNATPAPLEAAKERWRARMAQQEQFGQAMQMQELQNSGPIQLEQQRGYNDRSLEKVQFKNNMEQIEKQYLQSVDMLDRQNAWAAGMQQLQHELKRSDEEYQFANSQYEAMQQRGWETDDAKKAFGQSQLQKLDEHVGKLSTNYRFLSPEGRAAYDSLVTKYEDRRKDLKEKGVNEDMPEFWDGIKDVASEFFSNPKLHMVAPLGSAEGSVTTLGETQYIATPEGYLQQKVVPQDFQKDLEGRTKTVKGRDFIFTGDKWEELKDSPKVGQPGPMASGIMGYFGGGKSSSRSSSGGGMAMPSELAQVLGPQGTVPQPGAEGVTDPALANEQTAQALAGQAQPAGPTFDQYHKSLKKATMDDFYLSSRGVLSDQVQEEENQKAIAPLRRNPAIIRALANPRSLPRVQDPTGANVKRNVPFVYTDAIGEEWVAIKTIVPDVVEGGTKLDVVPLYDIDDVNAGNPFEDPSMPQPQMGAPMQPPQAVPQQPGMPQQPVPAQPQSPPPSMNNLMGGLSKSALGPSTMSNLVSQVLGVGSQQAGPPPDHNVIPGGPVPKIRGTIPYQSVTVGAARKPTKGGFTTVKVQNPVIVEEIYGSFVVLPTITEDGEIFQNKDVIIQQYLLGDKHLGVFATKQEAEQYAAMLRNMQRKPAPGPGLNERHLLNGMPMSEAASP